MDVRTAVIAGLVAATALAASPATAQAITGIDPATIGQPAAELRSVTGTVFTQKPSAEVQIATKGVKLTVGDMVGTEKGAFALVVFNDGSRVALRPESLLAIRGFSFKPDDPSQDKLSVELVKGWLRNVSGQIGKRGNQAAFDMQVSDTTIGIRGTDFAVRLCDEACAGGESRGDEGVLPQSGRLGQVLSADLPPQRTRDGITAPAPAGTVLVLGDTVSAETSEALLGLDDGTRLVLAPGSSVALRAEEDERGRRAIRLDVLRGTLRIATPPQAGARLYGLLVNAGELLGVRQDSALDIACEVDAPPTAFACPQASATLRRGRAEVLSDTAVRSLVNGQPTRLTEPAAEPATSPAAPAAPGASTDPTTPQTPAPPATTSPPGAAPATIPAVPATQPPAANPPATGARQGDTRLALTWLPEEWDTWAPGMQPRAAWRRAVAWPGAAPRDGAPGAWSGQMPPLHIAQATPLGAPGGGIAPPHGGLDPLDIPVDAARPPGAGAALEQGVYTAVFQGQIALARPAGQILIPAGQGGFAPATPQPPRALPAAPAFMERDQQLDRSRLQPEQCPR